MKNIIKITALVMAVILMAFSFAACTAAPAEDTANEASDTQKYSVTFYADEVPNFVADKVIKGMKVYDSTNDVDLGMVTEVLNDDSICYASNEGKLILTTKTGYRSLMVTVTVDAVESVDGWSIGDTLYGLGHKDTLHIGNTEVELTLRSVEAIG